MGKKTKIGKQRKDKYYHLAKETGYRSRAAFKLIQLNRKFEFLQKSKVCVDLCAAPGGWMQVAKQNMMASSIVIGVDLFPIKNIPGTISLVEDITTDKCRVAISREIKTWKADVVLHDGSPNVGMNWIFDSYQQCCLTLSALKLATGILKQGGWFVTKVFRSKDYTSLLWIFKQLFQKVHTTKPQASRKESAEIFVVCQYYLAPAKIDEKFFDPKYAFKDVAVSKDAEGKFSLLKKKTTDKKKAVGYPSDANVLYKSLPVSKFIEHETPTVLLQHATEIYFDDESIEKHPSTTPELKECCKDIKVLGRKDIRDLLKWWKVLHDEKVKLEQDETDEEENVVKKEGKDPEQEEYEKDEKELEKVSKEIAEIKDEERRELKRKRKKVLKEKQKLSEKLNLKMLLKGDLGPTEQDDGEMFQLSQIRTAEQLDLVTGSKPEVVADSEDEEIDILPKRVRFNVEKSQLDESGLFYKDPQDESDLEFESSEDEHEEDRKILEADDEMASDEDGLGLQISDDEDDVKKESARKGKKEKKTKMTEEERKKWETVDDHPLITKLDNKTQLDRRVQKASLWFDKDVFKNIEKEEDEDFELDKIVSILKEKGKTIHDKQTKFDKKNNNAKVAFAGVKPPNVVNFMDSEKGIVEKLIPQAPKIKESDEDGYGTDSDTYSSSDVSADDRLDEFIESDYDVNDAFDLDDDKDKDVIKPAKKKKQKIVKLSEEELALGSMMVNSKKTKRDLVDAAWNRYTFNDTNLPPWFEKDEKENMTKEDPVPEELIDEYRKKKVEINVRPIKKVVEAKARKKKRALRRMEKMKKKLEVLMEAPDVSDAEKARNIRALMKKAKQPKKEVKYVVAKKHTTAKKLRIKGIKGPYKVVDRRMKKDKRPTGKGGKGKAHKRSKKR